MPLPEALLVDTQVGDVRRFPTLQAPCDCAIHDGSYGIPGETELGDQFRCELYGVQVPLPPLIEPKVNRVNPPRVIDPEQAGIMCRECFHPGTLRHRSLRNDRPVPRKSPNNQPQGFGQSSLAKTGPSTHEFCCGPTSFRGRSRSCGVTGERSTYTPRTVTVGGGSRPPGGRPEGPAAEPGVDRRAVEPAQARTGNERGQVAKAPLQPHVVGSARGLDRARVALIRPDAVPRSGTNDAACYPFAASGWAMATARPGG